MEMDRWMVASTAAISWIGWIDPTSLLTAITETKIVSLRIMFANSDTLTKPWASTGTTLTSNPNSAN